MASLDIHNDSSVVRREKNNAAAARWRQLHPEQHRQSQIAFRQKNPAKRAAYNEARRLKKKEIRIAAGLPTWELIREPRTTLEGRVCTTCRERKPPDHFGKNSKRADGLRASCKACVNEKSRNATLSNPDHRRSIQWAAWLWKQYKITIGEYAALWERQLGRCPICNRELAMGTGKHAVDHSHKTGFVRGILCHHCNAGLGLFQDNPDLLMAAANYLQVAALHPKPDEDDD